MGNILDKLYQIQFDAQVFVPNGDIFEIEKYVNIKRLQSNQSMFSIHPVVILADPFLFVCNEVLYLFYEEQIDLRGKGVIKMVKTTDLEVWSEPIVVLQESFHLSYPNIFLIDEQVYMMPETGRKEEIRLYKANADLSEWTFYKTVLSGANFTDSTIYRNDGLLFLFTTICQDDTYSLKLYYSDSFDSNWVEHPQSPIAIGNNGGRCGGALIENNNRIYRPSQRCETIYGEGLDIFEVKELSKTNYREELFIEKLIPHSDPFHKNGGHHFNSCIFKKRTVIATDSISFHINLLEVGRRVSYKLTKR